MDNQIKEMNELFVKGTSKFKSEVEYGYRVPESQRYLIKFIDQDGDVNPKVADKVQIKLDLPEDEEIIESNYDSKLLY